MAFCSNCGAPLDGGVKFCPNCGTTVGTEAGQTNPNQGSYYANGQTQPPVQNNYYNQNMDGMISTKSRLAALLLCLFLGGLGIHRFYAGKVGSGIGMIVLLIIGAATSWLGVGIALIVALYIWVLVDFIMICVGSFTDGSGLRIKRWTD